MEKFKTYVKEAMVNPQSNLTKKQRQALASPAARAKSKDKVTLSVPPWEKKKAEKEGMTFMKPGPEKDKFHKDAKAKASAKIKDMIKKGEINFKSQKEGKAYGPTGIAYSTDGVQIMKKKSLKKGDPKIDAIQTVQKRKDKAWKDLAKKEDNDPCWKDYKMIGMKKKNGKTVPNCVPKEGNMSDLSYDADIHSNGSMKVKKMGKDIHLHGKSYHSSDDHAKVAKKMGMKISSHGKTMGGTRSTLTKESVEIDESTNWKGGSKFVSLTRYAAKNGFGLQITQTKPMLGDKVRLKDAYVNMPLKDIPKLIKALQTVLKADPRAQLGDDD